ncbi:MAG: alpha/beta hydrolase [Oceanipulchritudo sp.]
MKSIQYKATPGGAALSLHVFQPEPSRSAGYGKAVLFFHGGGWNGGTPEQFFPQCRELAQRGWVAMSAEYRVRQRHGTPPTASVADARSCVRWVLAHAEELGIDPDRLVLSGGSAGGHLALASLITDAFDDPREDSSIEPRAAGLVLFNPVADAGPEGYGYEQVRDVLEDFSPLHAMKKPLPPILILTGAADTTTPVAGMRAFRDKAVQFGGACELIEYEGQGHGFFNYNDGNNPCYRQTLDEMIRFLERIF